MKKQVRYLVIAMICSTFLSIDALASKTAESYRLCNLKQGNTVSLYQQPTEHSGVILKLSRNSKGIMKRRGYKKFAHSRWQEISWNRKIGWIKNSCLKVESNPKRVVSR